MLKQISFVGFKSFADKVVVDFSDGITGVIGPNGCGKSNIFDGIRWVLGEQSAKSLRGGKMEDVIFAGAESRKPGEFAEVTLVLDNSEGIFKSSAEKVISVRRKTSRKGGSEYSINDEPARLKDIHDLFLDSGIGSNSYSMIGQGQIEKILSTKLEDRRAIFEEASGIVKLRHQKESTEKRLEEVSNNVLRLEDVVKEIERQLFPLREQAQKAGEYNELTEELKTIEVQYLLHELDDIEIKMTDVSRDVSVLEGSISETDVRMDGFDTTLEGLKETYQIENERVFTMQEELSAIQTEIEKNNGNKTLVLERIENNKKSIFEIENNLKEIEENFSLSTEDFHGKQKRLKTLSDLLAKNEQLLSSVGDDISKLESEKLRLNTEVEFTRSKTTGEYNMISNKSFEMEQASKKEDELKEKSTALDDKLNTLKDENKALEIDVKEHTHSFETAKSNYEMAQSSLVNKQLEITRLKKTFEVTNTTLNDKGNEHYRAKSKFEQIEQLIESNEGYYDGVKAILNNKDTPAFKGVIGTVADSLQTKKKFEVAIETILQSTMQFLIVEDSDVAKSCVNELKSKQLGRATFLPLDLASSSPLSKEDEKKIAETDGVTLAMDAVSFDSKLDTVFRSLLGRSVIADTMDIALAFLKSSKSKVKIATLDGELIQSGSISGGASKKQKSGLLSRKRELVDYKNLADALEADIAKITIEVFELRTLISNLESDITSLTQEMDTLREMMQNKKIIYDEVQRKMESFEDKKQDIDVEIQENKLAIKEIRNTLLTLRMQLDDRRKSHEKSTDHFEKLQKDQTKNEADVIAMQENKTALMLELASAREEIRQIHEYLEHFSEDSESLEDKIERFYRRKNEEESRIVESQTSLESFDGVLVTLRGKHDVLQTELNTAKQENLKRHKSIEQMENDIKETRSNKESLEKDLNSKNLFLSKRETEKSNILTRFFEMYEMQEEDLSSVERLEIDFAASKKEVDKIKKRISALGNINHAAIEDCKNLEERYGTEKTQLTDIQGAKEDLDKLLKNVELEMTERFTTTFKEIAEHFERIFVEMFEGGNAKLTLADESDPLGTAIEIIAQPPGKRPQTINSLSGGEKAFTAVSLIFSIISAKPSPFVILDEVDAALDDANVARFAKTLKKFGQKSQFIVVTHRKGTMHIACEAIIGVSQETRGITIAFPFKLENIQDKKIL